MKLAEALILRADYQKRLEQLKKRLIINAKIQEGDTPAEAPADLLEEFERVAQELQQLIQRINKTNSFAQFEAGTTLADALANRDILVKKNGLYRDLAQAAGVSQTRATRSEVKFVSTVNVSAIQRQADDTARQCRELDTKIQAANWTVELI